MNEIKNLDKFLEVCKSLEATQSLVVSIDCDGEGNSILNFTKVFNRTLNFEEC